MFLVILGGGVVVLVAGPPSAHRPGEVGGVAGAGRVAATEAVAPTGTQGRAVALVEAVRVDLAQLEAVTGPGSVPGHFSPQTGPQTGLQTGPIQRTQQAAQLKSAC